ncbi:sugar phosphate isomerase/epimerase family protein [Paenibacillus cremeus]|uniref:Sugar phosphate isomerase/epimerase n=1 Tax=Paenibacillus cremeus TaxID=2163881 RepID=A0A559KE40_9BACL|nr:sugar phosphate isomerase/epimerase [Paenibacillus cremeus]TVY10402.1 sugar phosphate isomerase/epimerase [Paenibacillus cremeus]
MRFGILAHNLGKTTTEELARRVGSYGLGFVQLALAKALTDIDSSLGRLSPGLANHVADIFARENVRISVLGCYINPIDPDPEQRRLGIARFKEHLRYARDFGASVVATETGTLRNYREVFPNHSEEAIWALLRSAVEEMAEEAERWGVTLGLEASGTEVIHTPEQMHRMLSEVRSANIGIVMDPVNLLNPGNIDNQHDVIRRSFELWGDRIVLTHVKDMDVTPDGKKQYVSLGKGRIDYPFFLRLLQEYKPFMNLSFEGGVEPAEIPDAIEFLKKASRSE